jgi:hypothetical protein
MRSNVALRMMATAALATGAASLVRGQAADVPFRATAFAVDIGNSGPAAAERIELNVDRWSTDAERDQLLAAYTGKGAAGMLTALQKTRRVGTMRVRASLGYELHYARRTPDQDGGERIVLATDRPIEYWETRQWRPIRDFPFTVIEIHVNASGEGEGRMSVAAKVTYSEATGSLEMENYANQAVQLQSVRLDAR